MNRNNSNKGFSLVELIIVIAIMAVLVGVLAPQFVRYVERARQSRDVQSLDAVKEAISAYYTDEAGAVNSWSAVQDDGALTFTVSDMTPLNKVGITTIKLESKSWSKVKLTYTVATNKWLVEGNASYYKSDGQRFIKIDE